MSYVTSEEITTGIVVGILIIIASIIAFVIAYWLETNNSNNYVRSAPNDSTIVPIETSTNSNVNST